MGWRRFRHVIREEGPVLLVVILFITAGIVLYEYCVKPGVGRCGGIILKKEYKSSKDK